MLTPGLVYPGSQIDIRANFKDAAEADIDPATVKLRLMSPERVETVFTYGSSADLTRQSVGDYTCRVTPDKAGRWRFRWETTGTGTTIASEGDFLVQRSAFVDDPCGYFRDYC